MIVPNFVRDYILVRLIVNNRFRTIGDDFQIEL